MSLSELLAQSASLWKKSAAQAVALVAVLAVPAALLVAAALAATGLLSQESLNEAVRAGRWTLALPVLAAGLVQRLALTLGYAAVVFAVDARRAGKPLPLTEALGFAVERLIPLLLAMLRAAAWILGGLILLIIPGLVIAARYAYVHLAVLLEGRNGGDALRRSAALVDADPVRAVGFLAVAFVLSGALTFSAFLLVSAAASVARPIAASVGAIEGQLEMVLYELVSAVIGAWLTAFGVLLYRDLAQ